MDRDLDQTIFSMGYLLGALYRPNLRAELVEMLKRPEEEDGSTASWLSLLRDALTQVLIEAGREVPEKRA